jgi:hypothetical protein
MHPIERAYELLDEVDATLDRAAIEDARRPFDQPDACDPPPDWRGKSVGRMTQHEFSAWCDAGKPPLEQEAKPKENRMTQDIVTRGEMRAHIQQAIKEAISIVGEEVGTIEREMREEYNAAIAELRAELVVIRAELNNRKRQRSAKPVNLGVTHIDDLGWLHERGGNG